MSTLAQVSVLVATYNRADLLGQSLDSLLAQTVPPAQVIVVDDGSTDETAQCVAAYGPAVTYLRKPNGGKASALNLALARVTGDFVWVFDDDDVADRTSLADHLALFEAQPEAGLVLSRHYWGATSPAGVLEVRSEATWPPLDADHIVATLMLGCFTMLQGALVRRACYDAVGPFREELLRSQDYDMLLRLVRRFPVALLDRPSFILRRHTGQRGPAAIRHAAADREQVWTRYDGLLGQHLRREASLGEYLSPPVAGELSEPQRRAALLARMSVMASKGLGAEMLEDAVELAATSTHRDLGQLTTMERLQAVAAVQHRYFLLGVVSRWEAFRRDARRLTQYRLGRSLLRAFARGLLGLARWADAPLRERVGLVRKAADMGLLAVLPASKRSP